MVGQEMQQNLVFDQVPAMKVNVILEKRKNIITAAIIRAVIVNIVFTQHFGGTKTILSEQHYGDEVIQVFKSIILINI